MPTGMKEEVSNCPQAMDLPDCNGIRCVPARGLELNILDYRSLLSPFFSPLLPWLVPRVRLDMTLLYTKVQIYFVCVSLCIMCAPTYTFYYPVSKIKKSIYNPRICLSMCILFSLRESASTRLWL